MPRAVRGEAHQAHAELEPHPKLELRLPLARRPRPRRAAFGATLQRSRFRGVRRVRRHGSDGTRDPAAPVLAHNLTRSLWARMAA